MRRTYIHDEIGCGFSRPRHPILCLIDLFGIALTLTLVGHYKPNFVVAILPLAIILQYAVSVIYHWLPSTVLRRKIDHMMIAILIAATFVPYWGTLLSPSQMYWRLPVLGLLTLATCVMNGYPPWRKVGAIFYIVLGSFGLIVSFNELQVWLPPFALAEFWLGVLCYFVQFVIVMKEKLDLHPGVFGYREVQHVILLGGTTLHTLVVLQYL